jgi:hypothetical protein
MTGPIAVARMPPISLDRASCVNRVRAPNSSAIVTLSRANRPSTPRFRPAIMPSSRAAVLPLVISSIIGNANAMVARDSTVYIARRPNRSPSMPTSGTVAKPAMEPHMMASVGSARSMARLVAM